MSQRGRASRSLFLVVGVALVASMFGSGAQAHSERPAEFPDGNGSVPKYRPYDETAPNLVVCKEDSAARIAAMEDPEWQAWNEALLGRCAYSHINDALAAVEAPGTNVYVLPGHYIEDPYRARPECADELPSGGNEEGSGAPILSYAQQVGCPYYENLIPILGDTNPGDDERVCDGPLCDLQIEGTGESAEDVVIDGGYDEQGNFNKLNGIRGDRADGLYLKNFTIQLFEFNAVYILETDGFVIDDVIARWNDEYGFLTFAVDHGVYQYCEGYGNGDSGIYPGSASDVNDDNPRTEPIKRWAIEIKYCNSHDNALGYSGTAGNSVYAHDNFFHHNATGIATDSVFPDHPGLPQDHGRFEDNWIFSNNVNFYEKYVHTGICDLPAAERGYEDGTVCPVIPAPVGTGMMIAGGNYNFIARNYVFDNWRSGFMLFGVPAAVRDEMDPSKQFDTSNFNNYVNNFMGISPLVGADRNGIDFWWDDQGEGNCWQGNVGPNGAAVTSNTMYPFGLPTCTSGGSRPIPLNPFKQGPLVPCVTYDRSDETFRDPPGCTWFDTPTEPN